MANKNEELSKEQILDYIFNEPIENGLNLNESQPLVKSIENIVKKMVESENDPEYIKKVLEKLNEITSEKSTLNPELKHQLTSSLKMVFNVPRVSTGQVSEESVLSEVLMNNNDLSTSLFANMINSNLSKNSENKNILDMDISSMLYMGHLQNLATESPNSLINSDIVNKMLNEKKIREICEPSITEGGDNNLNEIINGFKSLESLSLISPQIKNHLKNQEKKNETDGMTLLGIEAIENTIKDIKSKNSLENEEVLKNRKTLMSKVNSMDLIYNSANTLDDKLKAQRNIEDGIVSAKAEQAAKIRTEEENLFLMSSFQKARIEAMQNDNITEVGFMGKLNSNNRSYATNNNPFITSLNMNDKYGNPLSTIANFTFGTATIQPKFVTNIKALQNVFHKIRADTVLKENQEFNLYLRFKGDNASGAAYIESSIMAAMEMKPPIPLENIHVEKRFQSILLMAQEKYGYLASDKPISGDDKDEPDEDQKLVTKAEEISKFEGSQKENPPNEEDRHLKEVRDALSENNKTTENAFDNKKPVDENKNKKQVSKIKVTN